MASLEIGRVCMKIAGRESGKYCTVVKKVNAAFVLVSGPRLLTGVKRRKSNIAHVEPLPYLLDIKEDATDEQVIEAFDKAGLITKLKLKKPSAAHLKSEKSRPAKTEEKKEAKKAKKEEKK